MSAPGKRAPPETIGRYQVLGHLATGGMAEVLLGKLLGPSGFERAVVIKRILSHLAREESFVKMFLDEARIVASIRHGNVVQVHELGQEGEQLYLVMEYLEGESTDGILRRLASRKERLDWGLCAHIVAEACAGLHAAHELTDDDGRPKNLVHRDVSPQNIFVTYSGEVKVLDFGIAKTSDRQARTEAGYMKGKYAYMSPEQIRGEPLDRRCDVFAMGIVLYELSTGRRLFARKNELMVMKAICDEEITPPSRMRAGYPPWLEQIVMRALSRRREDRFESAAEMRRFLLAAVRMLGLSDTRDELLAAQMKRLFADRIAEKREMLRRVRSGADLTHVPTAEVGTPVEIPVVIDAPGDEPVVDTPLSVEVPAPEALRGGSRKRSWMVAAAGSFLVTAAVVLWFAWPGAEGTDPQPAGGPTETPTETAGTEPAAPADAPEAEAPPAPAPAPPAAPAEVTVEIQTRPAGATVLIDGSERGHTPVRLQLARGDQPIDVTLRLARHEERVEAVRPDVDQRLRFDLTVARPVRPAPRGRPGPAPTPAKTPPPGGGFFRYD